MAKTDILPDMEQAFIRGGIAAVHQLLRDATKTTDPAEKLSRMIKRDLNDNEGRHAMQLLEYGPSIAADGSTYSLLQTALFKNHNAAAAKLIEMGSDVHYHKDKSTPLSMAILGDNLDGLKLLMEAGVSVNEFAEDGTFLLQYAAHAGSENTLGYFLDSGMDPNKLGKYKKTVIGSLPAIMSNEKLSRMVDRLLAAGANIQMNGNGWPLRDALIHGNIRLFEKLASLKADLNAVDDQGVDLISIALKMRTLPNLLSKMNEMGARISRVKENEWSPLTTVISSGLHYLLKEYLKDNPDQVDMLGYEGMTLLQFAAAHNHYGPYFARHESAYVWVADVLIKAGANINHTGKSGWSPLMLAARHGNVHMVHHLIEAGADLNIKSPRGKTAADVAKHPHILAMLNALPHQISSKM